MTRRNDPRDSRRGKHHRTPEQKKIISKQKKREADDARRAKEKEKAREVRLWFGDWIQGSRMQIDSYSRKVWYNHQERLAVKPAEIEKILTQDIAFHQKSLSLNCHLRKHKGTVLMDLNTHGYLKDGKTYVSIFHDLHFERTQKGMLSKVYWMGSNFTPVREAEGLSTLHQGDAPIKSEIQEQIAFNTLSLCKRLGVGGVNLESRIGENNLLSYFISVLQKHPEFCEMLPLKGRELLREWRDYLE